MNLGLGLSAIKGRGNDIGETKSEIGMPLTMGYKGIGDKYNIKLRQPTVGGGYFNKKKGIQTSFDQVAAVSAVGGVSAVEFQVYKQGYNKLKDKYRKQAQNARS